jgi:hypothetical protein
MYTKKVTRPCSRRKGSPLLPYFLIKEVGLVPYLFYVCGGVLSGTR